MRAQINQFTPFSGVRWFSISENYHQIWAFLFPPMKKSRIRVRGPKPSPWIRKNLESWQPEEIVEEVTALLNNETACVGLLKAFAAFNAMAATLGNDDDVKCCCRMMDILDQIRKGEPTA